MPEVISIYMPDNCETHFFLEGSGFGECKGTNLDGTDYAWIASKNPQASALAFIAELSMTYSQTFQVVTSNF